MLRITIPAVELYDEGRQEFVYLKAQTLQLEHSLVSLSKWESKWHKPFLGREDKTIEETRDYIRCMTLTQNVDPSVYSRLTDEHVNQVNEYIRNPMTATRISDDGTTKRNNDIITSEIIYYWMIGLGIPSEYQKWHLNRLLTLIRVCDIKNKPEKKMSMKERISRQKEINERNKKRWNTKG